MTTAATRDAYKFDPAAKARRAMRAARERQSAKAADHREKDKERLLRAAKRSADPEGCVGIAEVAKGAHLRVGRACELVAELKAEERWPYRGLPTRGPRTAVTPAQVEQEAGELKAERIDSKREKRPVFRHDVDAIRHEFRAVCKRRGWASIMPRYINWKAGVT